MQEQTKPQDLAASLVFQHRNDVLCTSCGMYKEAKEMEVWYVNAEPKPFGPGKRTPEVHYICATEKCRSKIQRQKGAGN